MATVTTTDLIVRVLDLLGVTQVGQNPAAEDVEKVSAFIPDTLQDLQDRRVATINPAAIDARFTEPLATILASRAGVAFGQPRNNDVEALEEARLKVNQAAAGGEFTRRGATQNGDTQRAIARNTPFAGDTSRSLARGPTFAGDTARDVNRASTFAGDAQRTPSRASAFAGDTARDVNRSSAFAGDAQRQLTRGSQFAGDVQKAASRDNRFAGDAQRPLTRQSTFAGDKPRGA